MSLEEFLARCITARKMKLIHDPNGVLLPEELWQRRLPEARFVLGAIHAYELHREVLRFHQVEDEGE